MKFTQSEAVESLKTFFPDAEIVDEGSTYNRDEFLKGIDTVRTPILAPQIQDAYHKEKIAQIRAAQGGELRGRLAKLTGMKRSELDEIKDDNEAMDKAFSYKASLLDSEKGESKKQIDEILQNHKSEMELLTQKFESEIQTERGKFMDKEENEYFSQVLNEAPLPKGSDRTLIAKDWKKAFKEKYDLRYEDGKFVPYKKGTDLPLLNEAGTDHFNFLDDAKPYLEPRGLWQKDMSNVNPQEIMQGQQRQEELPKITGGDLATKKAAFDAQMKTILEKA